MPRLFSAFCLCLLLTIVGRPDLVRARSLTEDTVWQGTMTVEEDTVVPAGITLTIKPGTRVLIVASDSTKTDPEFLSPLTEITVRGVLRIEGTTASPVTLGMAPDGVKDRWAGILVNGGQVMASHCRITEAENAIQVTAGSLMAEKMHLTQNRYAIVAQGQGSRVALADSEISGNDYGLLALAGARIVKTNVTIAGNAKKDILTSEQTPTAVFPVAGPAEQEIRRRYGDEVLLGDTVWQGRILVNGLIRLPVASRLIILPGSVIEFAKIDTNHDTIGENGLMIQGLLIAKGTPAAPIVFRSAEKIRRPGDWDAINIINSDGARNLIEHCRIEDAYRGLHFHFANVAVLSSRFTNNLRGIQFQESAVDIRANTFFGNNSAIQARDSEIDFHDNILTDNLAGANFFRTSLVATGNTIFQNFEYGLKIREGFPRIGRNSVFRNRYGLMLQDTRFGEVNANLIVGNIESGLSLNTVDNTTIHSNYVHDNGVNGINIRDTKATIADNQISDNGERGIGIQAFYGIITRNAFSANGRYHIENEGSPPVSAPLNWFVESDPGAMIWDGVDQPGLGRVDFQPVLARPDAFEWPLPVVPTSLTWRGAIDLPSTIMVPPGVNLAVAPGTRVSFAEKSGLVVQGKLLASGRPEQRILFTSLTGKGKSSWDEIRLEHADGSLLSHCDVEFATWGLHSHFTYLPITGCRFRENHGGIRFRSGPLVINDSLFTGNVIGIRSYKGRAVIEGNVITGNEKGIFIREQGSGLSITHNNIFANLDYNIRLGEFNNEDVAAPENWWGTDKPGDTFFDARQEPGIGLVQYEPFLDKPLALKVPEYPALPRGPEPN